MAVFVVAGDLDQGEGVTLHGAHGFMLAAHQHILPPNGPTLEQRVLWFDDLEEQTTAWGAYFGYRGRVQADGGQPLQPQYVASTFATSGPVHGVALVEGAYSDTPDFDPVVALPADPNGPAPDQEPELRTEGWAPARMIDVRRLPGILGEGLNETLIVQPGQFDVRQRVERLYERVTVMLYRSDREDWTPPGIGLVRSTPQAEGVQVTVGAGDASGIYTVLVTYTAGDEAWHSAELAQGTHGTWQGTLPATEDLSFFVQVVDAAGNVAVADNSGRYYGSCVLCGDVEQVYLPLLVGPRAGDGR